MYNRELHFLLEEKFRKYNTPDFIELDPVVIPHSFSRREDIEISAFFAATLAWGQRKTIISNAKQLMHLMDNSPASFVINCKKKDLKSFEKFAHRTFNGEDCITFITALQRIYLHHNGLENIFATTLHKNDMATCISGAKEIFFKANTQSRTTKHFADPIKNSSAKRICMFLRWMIRKDNAGVDFGIWDKITPAHLHCPLDVHTTRSANALGLLHRTQADWKAVQELTAALRTFDATDPAKYDFALFGLSAYEGLH